MATNLIGKKELTSAQLLETCLECGAPDIYFCSKPENQSLIPTVATALLAKASK